MTQALHGSLRGTVEKVLITAYTRVYNRVAGLGFIVKRVHLRDYLSYSLNDIYIYMGLIQGLSRGILGV